MRSFAPRYRPIAACAAVFACTLPAAAQQAPQPQAAPQQTQAAPQPDPMHPGAQMYPGGPMWPGGMRGGPMHRGMMQQQGQPGAPQATQQPQGGAGMMRGPMHQGMPMQPQMPQQDAQDQQPGPGQMTQYPMMHGPMMYGPGMHHGYMGPMGGPMLGGGMCPIGGPDFADGRLAFIKAELGITDQQQAAFDGFAKILKSHAEGRQERHEAMMQAMSQVQSPLDRLGARITMMEMRVGMMKEMKAALDKLYGALSDEQKRKADFLLPGMGGMRCMM